jgi:hypothetical protein
MFCTPSDFNLIPYAIPNVEQFVNTLQPYIDVAEERILKQLLGVQLYNEFIAGRALLPSQWVVTTSYLMGQQVVDGISIWEAVSDNNGVQPVEGSDWKKVEDNKWLKLEMGFVFIYQDSCCHGDHSTEWLGLVSMLTPYIFYSWLRDTWDNYSGIGVVQPKAENADFIAPSRRLVDAYTDFAEQANTMLAFVQTSAYLDPNVYNCCACWPGDVPGSINTFGI